MSQGSGTAQKSGIKVPKLRLSNHFTPNLEQVCCIVSVC